MDCIELISIAFHANCFYVPDFGYISAVCKDLKTPVISSITGSEIAYLRISELLDSAGVLTYVGPEAATTGIGAGYQYALHQRKKRTQPNFQNWHKVGTNQKIKLLLDKVREENRRALTEKESKYLLLEAGINVTECFEAKSCKEAVQLAEEIGKPVVLKVSSTKIIHKSDIGGVKINLGSQEEISKGYEEILRAAKPFDKNALVTIQKMIKPGIELLIGVTTDQVFGPIIAFGIGGVFAEIFKDVSTRIIPIQDCDADAMIREFKGYPILKGYRDTPKANIDMLRDFLVKISDMITEYPMIKEIDLNPVMCTGDSAVAVDARILI